MLEQEQKFYTGHREELREKYLGKRIVIVGEEFLGVYESDREALDAMADREPGTFMVKYVPVDPEDEIFRIYSPYAYA
jgi:hypothetical protein